MNSTQGFSFAVLGAGGRGQMFSKWIKENAQAGKVVAVAEPNAERRKIVADAHQIPAEMQFEDWRALVAKPKFADVMINTLMDRDHAPSAVPALKKGYHMLLEKPMATTLEDCVAIDKARRDNKRIVAVCHSLRYHCVYTEIKRLLDSGAIGRLVSFDQLEAVEHIHQSHSFVRGNWGNEGRSTFMLMAKSCHDIDIIAYMVGKKCRRVSSFGELTHFCKKNAPAGAPERCTDPCPAEASCPYSVYKVYMGPNPFWGVWHAGIGGKPFAEQLAFLKQSNYGRCVYHCDNDVVDHQVVAFDFEDGITGTFTMTGFTPFGGRFVRLHGTLGYMAAQTEGNQIELHRYADGAHNKIKIAAQAGGHGGADDNVMRSFMHALRSNDPQAVLTTTAESLASHKIAFAAERSRRERRMVELAELDAKA